MGKFAQSVAAAAFQDVEIDGATWRIQPLTSAEMVRNGHAFLAIFPTGGEAKTPEEAQARAEEIQEALKHDEEAGVRMVNLRDTIVCAGVLGGDAGDGFEPVRFVMRQEDEDASGDVPRVWVGGIPAPTLIALQNAIVALCSDNGRLARALESFRS